jgi:MFS family permease
MGDVQASVRTSPWSPRVIGFLGAEALSALGSFATMVAIWGYAAFRFDASPGELSLYGLAFSLPGVVLGPVAGAVVDRLGPKSTLAASKVLGIAASLALLTVDTFRSMVVLTAAHGIAMTFAQPALQSMPPRLVDEEHLATTNALVGMTDESSLILGPAVGGIAIAAFGFHGAFIVDAVTYAVGLLVLPMVPLRPRVAVEGTGPATSPREVFAGWALVARTPVLRRTVTCTSVVFALYGLALLTEPLYVRDVLERSPSVFAALQTAFGVFLVGGGILAVKLGDRIASVRWVAFGVAGSGVAALLYLGTPWIGMAFFGVAVWGLFTAMISGPSRTVLQRATPEHAHGRVLAADMVAANAAMLLGTVLGGPLVDALEVRGAVALLGGLAVVAGVLVSGRREEVVAEHEVERERLVADVVEEDDDRVTFVP